jgi:hypothetical protein
VVGLVDTAASVAGSTSLSPWGERGAGTGTGQQTAIGFQGDPTDADTGLVDMLTRN